MSKVHCEGAENVFFLPFHDYRSNSNRKIARQEIQNLVWVFSPDPCNHYIGNHQNTCKYVLTNL